MIQKKKYMTGKMEGNLVFRVQRCENLIKKKKKKRRKNQQRKEETILQSCR